MSSLMFIQPKLSGVGGIEKVVPLIGVGLEKSGYVVSSASFYGENIKNFSGNNYFRNEEISNSVFKKAIKIVVRFIWLRNIINLENPRALIVSGHGAILICLILKKVNMIKVPVIVYEHQSLILNDFGYGLLRRLIYKSADGFIAVSQGILLEIEKKFKHIPKVLVYNPVPSTSKRSSIPRDPVFVSASRLEYVKGVDILVALFIKYITGGGKGKLIIYGEGKQKALLDKMISESGFENKIKLMGKTEHLVNELDNVTAYVSCARNEALGVSLLEALSVGVPIVCSDVPYGPREIMLIGPEEKIKYPYISGVGIIYGEVNDCENFCKSLELVSNNSLDFTKGSISRASEFSIKNAVDALDSFFKKNFN